MALKIVRKHSLNKSSMWLIFIAMALLAGRMGSVYGNSGAPIYYENDQVVIKLAPGTTIDEINATYATSTIRPLLNSSGIYLLQLPEGTTADQLVQTASHDSRLLYAELNYIGIAPEAHSVDIQVWPEGDPDPQDPNDPNATDPTQTLREFYEWESGGSESAHYINQPAVHVLKLSTAHAISRGQGIIVAVLDTGVDLSHPVLVPHLTAARYDFIDDNSFPQDEFNGIDDDGNGFIDEVAGHGTHVAGIIHLVAPESKIMPLRVLDSDGQGNIFLVAEAILYAVEHGARVINLSLGTVHPSSFLMEVVDQVTQQGVIVVGAAGNMNMDVPQYPAATACSLAVTAVGPGLIKSKFASYGEWVDLAAPGKRIYSTYPGDGYAWWSGTSMATPFVAGQLALLFSAEPTLTIEDAGRIMGETVRPLAPPNHNYAGQLGAGLIDIGGSLSYLVNGQWANSSPQILSGCSS